MKEESKQLLWEAIVRHPLIAGAAITGSLARPGGEDPLSDLDIFLVVQDFPAVANVRGWFPPRLPILICEFHLTHYCSVLLEDLEKIDLALFSVDHSPQLWIVHDYRMVKGTRTFEDRLAEAALATRTVKAEHLRGDVNMDSAVLLLLTAWKRAQRGEELSAHGSLAMAADMVASLERRQRGIEEGADLLDPWRRLEKTRGDLAAVLHQCLFTHPAEGIPRLAKFLAGQRAENVTREQARVLRHIQGTSASRV